VLVATPAFGMGVHHPSVRNVIHHSIPLSLSDYAQSSGRAGRDGLPARCVLFFQTSDFKRASGLVGPAGQGDLDEVISMCLTGSCVRLAIARHMGENVGDKCQVETCAVCYGGGVVKGEASTELRTIAIPRVAPRPSQRAPVQRLVIATVHESDLDTGFDEDGDAARIVESLRSWLVTLAKRRGLNVAKDVPNRLALKRAVKEKPKSRMELELLPGFGPHKTELWFDDLVKKRIVGDDEE